MTKLEYLKLAIQNNCFNSLAWLISIFGIVGSIPKEKLKYLDLTYEANGYNYLDETGQLVPISDVSTRPFCVPTETLIIDNTWLTIVKDSLETTIGRLVANAVCIQLPFRGNVSYINKKFTVGTVEAIVAPIVLSDPDDLETKEPNKVYISDYIKFLDSIYYISNLSSIIVVSASPKVITKPEGLEDFFKQLVEKYKGKLHDAVEITNFENELKAFDDKYLKDEASYGLFISGKVKDIARKKLFLTIGVGLDFKEKTKLEPILRSLSEGWSLTPEEHRSMMNDIRYGSFSRGAETMKGGVTFKTLIRAINGVKVQDDDCGTKLTLNKVFYGDESAKLVDRTIMVNGKPVFISNKEQALSYADKEVELRTPMYCKLPNDTFCSTCVGKKISNNRDSLAILITEVSSIILKTALKVMHGTVLSTAKIDLNKHFS